MVSSVATVTSIVIGSVKKSAQIAERLGALRVIVPRQLTYSHDVFLTSGSRETSFLRLVESGRLKYIWA